MKIKNIKKNIKVNINLFNSIIIFIYYIIRKFRSHVRKLFKSCQRFYN